MVEIKHLCLCLLFSSTHFSIYKDTFAFYKDTKCVQGHAILMPALYSIWQLSNRNDQFIFGSEKVDLTHAPHLGTAVI